MNKCKEKFVEIVCMGSAVCIASLLVANVGALALAVLIKVCQFWINWIK